MSQISENSQTASDYIASQLRLEADAREALPYQFDSCTKSLGPLRQSVFACLTCTPPPASPHQQFAPAGVCYSCSISCHGEHNLVELFSKRDFVCDCGTTRLSNSGTPCTLRLNPATGRKGGVIGEEAREGNKYNHNHEGKFCGCGEEYDPAKEKGTMFQCLGLGNVEDGGCGEDWWHPECLLGLPRQQPHGGSDISAKVTGALETVEEEAEGRDNVLTENGTVEGEHHEDEQPLPSGFPKEDDFDHFICYKCLNAFPWMKQYAGAEGFLPAVSSEKSTLLTITQAGADPDISVPESDDSKKRKAQDDMDDPQDSKKAKSDTSAAYQEAPLTQLNGHAALHENLPPACSSSVNLFLKEDFRDHLCRCPTCFPRLARHPQLLEEESSYEPPLSESDTQSEHESVGGRSINSGSLLERGEAALSSMDRVRAIEGVMAYNHVRDKVKAFLQPFVENGKVVGAEDVKAYFAQLRGDEQALRETLVGAAGGDGEGDPRREQRGH